MYVFFLYTQYIILKIVYICETFDPHLPTRWTILFPLSC